MHMFTFFFTLPWGTVRKPKQSIIPNNHPAGRQLKEHACMGDGSEMK